MRPRCLEWGASVVLAACLWATPAPAATELVVSAAISLKDALGEIARAFEAAHPGVIVRLNLGASGDLAQQAEAGAPVDVFLSAATHQLDQLARQGLIRGGTRVVFAANALVVVVPVRARLDLATAAHLLRPEVRRVVIGNPKTVPAGQYAEESLRALGVWEALGERLVLAENVRQALEYVARDEVDAGLVYRTDAAVRTTAVRVAFALPSGSYTPIVYPAAVMRDARDPALARAFLDWLVSPQGQAIFSRYGFQMPPRAR
jgi:molybdate transport system substrate-binding protein